ALRAVRLKAVERREAAVKDVAAAQGSVGLARLHDRVEAARAARTKLDRVISEDVIRSAPHQMRLLAGLAALLFRRRGGAVAANGHPEQASHAGSDDEIVAAIAGHRGLHHSRGGDQKQWRADMPRAVYRNAPGVLVAGGDEKPITVRGDGGVAVHR